MMKTEGATKAETVVRNTATAVIAVVVGVLTGAWIETMEEIRAGEGASTEIVAVNGTTGDYSPHSYSHGSQPDPRYAREVRSQSRDRLRSRSPLPEMHHQHEYLGPQDQNGPISVLLTKGKHSEGRYRRGIEELAFNAACYFAGGRGGTECKCWPFSLVA